MIFNGRTGADDELAVGGRVHVRREGEHEIALERAALLLHLFREVDRVDHVSVLGVDALGGDKQGAHELHLERLDVLGRLVVDADVHIGDLAGNKHLEKV